MFFAIISNAGISKISALYPPGTQRGSILFYKILFSLKSLNRPFILKQLPSTYRLKFSITRLLLCKYSEFNIEIANNFENCYTFLCARCKSIYRYSLHLAPMLKYYESKIW